MSKFTGSPKSIPKGLIDNFEISHGGLFEGGAYSEGEKLIKNLYNLHGSLIETT